MSREVRKEGKREGEKERMNATKVDSGSWNLYS